MACFLNFLSSIGYILTQDSAAPVAFAAWHFMQVSPARVQIAGVNTAVTPLQVLAREEVLPSRNGVVVQAALRASVQLALSRQDPTQLIPRQVCCLSTISGHLGNGSHTGCIKAPTQLAVSHRTPLSWALGKRAACVPSLAICALPTSCIQGPCTAASSAV